MRACTHCRPHEQESADGGVDVEDRVVSGRHDDPDGAGYRPENQDGVDGYDVWVPIIDLDGFLGEEELDGDHGEHVQYRVPPEIYVGVSALITTSRVHETLTLV